MGCRQRNESGLDSRLIHSIADLVPILRSRYGVALRESELTSGRYEPKIQPKRLISPGLAGTANGFDAGSAEYRDALVGGIASHHGHAIAGGGQMRLAVGLDGQAPHDINVGV